jgi:ABC-2 type transport system permease protein
MSIASRRKLKIPTICRIARREAVDFLRDRRLITVAVLVILLLSVSVWIGAQRYFANQKQQEILVQGERERWLTQGERHPHSAAHQGFWVFEPATILSVADPGITMHAGAAVHLEPHRQRLFRYSPAENATWLQRAGELTAAVTLEKFIPLLIILIGFATLAGERENGRLRLVLSSGVSPETLAAGKALGLFIPLTLVLAPISVLGGLALAFNGEFGHGPLLLRSLPMAGTYLAYFAVFVLITLTVSALAGTSRRAITILLFIWIAGVLLAPPAVLSIAGRQYPTPTALEFESSLQRARAHGPLYFERLVATEDRLLKQYHVSSVDELPVNSEGVAMIAEEAEEDALHDVEFRQLYEALHGQGRVFQFGALASPLVAVQALSMGLGGTDLAHHLHFAQAAEDYRRSFVQMMNADLKENDFPEARRPASASTPNDLIYVNNRSLWEKVPLFVYIPPGLDWIARENWMAAVALTTWLLVAIVVGTTAIKRFAKEFS